MEQCLTVRDKNSEDAFLCEGCAREEGIASKEGFVGLWLYKTDGCSVCGRLTSVMTRKRYLRREELQRDRTSMK